MGIFKKIWHWLSQDVTKGFQKSDEEFMLKSTTYNTVGYTGDVDYSEASKIRREGTKIKGGVNQAPTTPRPNFTPPPQNPLRDFKREADEHFRQQQVRRDSDDNFLIGAMVAYVITDSLNDTEDSPSARDIEVPKSSNYESSYTPSSSSSYDSGSYSSSFDSDSSSSSCDSGC